MEKNIKCKICGSAFLVIMAISYIANSVCESCHKKLEENPDIKEYNYMVRDSDNLYRIGMSDTTSSVVSNSGFTINNFDKFKK